MLRQMFKKKSLGISIFLYFLLHCNFVSHIHKIPYNKIKALAHPVDCGASGIYSLCKQFILLHIMIDMQFVSKFTPVLLRVFLLFPQV